MFDKGLNDIKELEYLEDLEKASEVKRVATSSSNFDDFSGSLLLNSLTQLSSLPGRTTRLTPSNSLNV